MLFSGAFIPEGEKKTAALIWGCRFVWVVEFVVC
jgi:hypothetical protein